MSDEEADEGSRTEGVHTGERKKIDRNELPLFYRIVLKIPGISFFENASGAFWAICMPILIFLDTLANLWLLIYFHFPTNIILIAIVPTLALLLFIRINFERFINFWNMNMKPSEWNIKRAVQEYEDLTRKKEGKQ